MHQKHSCELSRWQPVASTLRFVAQDPPVGLSVAGPPDLPNQIQRLASSVGSLRCVHSLRLALGEAAESRRPAAAIHRCVRRRLTALRQQQVLHAIARFAHLSATLLQLTHPTVQGCRFAVASQRAEDVTVLRLRVSVRLQRAVRLGTLLLHATAESR